MSTNWSFGARYVYYAIIFIALLLLLAAFYSINVPTIPAPNIPTSPVGALNNATPYEMPPISPNSLVNYTANSTFIPVLSSFYKWVLLGYENASNQSILYGFITHMHSKKPILIDLYNDSYLVPVVNQTNKYNITMLESLKFLLSLNASIIPPVPYWEAADLAQFLNMTPTGYTLLKSGAVPLSDKENQTWTQNYVEFNITKYEVHIYSVTYPPSTNVTFHVVNSLKAIPKYYIRYLVLWPSYPPYPFGTEGFSGDKVTINGNDICFVNPVQRGNTGLIYTVQSIAFVPNSSLSIVMKGGATTSTCPGDPADYFEVGIAFGEPTTWSLIWNSNVHVIYMEGHHGAWVHGNTWLPVSNFVILAQWDQFLDINEIDIWYNNNWYEFVWHGNNQNLGYQLGDVLYENLTITPTEVIYTVINLNNSEHVNITVPFSLITQKTGAPAPKLQSGIYTIFIGGVSGGVSSNWYANYAALRYEVVNYTQVWTQNITFDGYTYNGTDPITWFENGSTFKIVRVGDGPFTINVSLTFWGNSTKPYNETIWIFSNDTLVMDMRYGDLVIPRNYTALYYQINVTPWTIPNQYGGYNYTFNLSYLFIWNPVPDYVVVHPPPSFVFNNNFAAEYLEWAEYKMLADEIENYSIAFTENVTNHMNQNYTKYWMAEAYAITANMLVHQFKTNISAKYQHPYPIMALWDGNATQYEANLNLALILENLMPVNMTVGEYYNLTDMLHPNGYWVKNWSYDFVDVVQIPPYWQNFTSYISGNVKVDSSQSYGFNGWSIAYLTDLGSHDQFFTIWQRPNITNVSDSKIVYYNVTFYNPLPQEILYHYGSYYLQIPPIMFFNITAVQTGLVYNETVLYEQLFGSHTIPT